MPSIVAVPYPDRGHVLLEINVADVPGAVYVCVEARTATLTRQLHPYVSYNGDGCIAVSCGQAILWDTEVSCDVDTVYCLTPINAAGEAITQPGAFLVQDTFTRVTVASWGVADTGETWSVAGGAAADYTVTGTRGQQALTSTSVQRVSTIDAGSPNVDISVTWTPQVVATGAIVEGKIVGRRTAAANTDYRMSLRADLLGVARLLVERNLGGVFTTLGNVVLPFTYTAATLWGGRLQLWGNQIKARAWDASGPEPTVWDVTATDSAITTGTLVELRSQRLAGNTNGTVNAQWDDLIIADVCAEMVPIEVCSSTVNLPCTGCFRLSDPVRPCHEVQVCECPGGVECGGTGGIVFGGITADTYDSNSGEMLPVNGIYPIHISRNRRAPTGSLSVMPRSFADRDELLDVLQPGSVVLWRGPAEYGIGDRYLAIGDVPVAPVISDLTQQQRLVELPFATVAPVVGPTQGVCGARVMDLCDTYASWDALIAAGVTYAAMLRGDAGGVPSGLATWAEIDAENASWAALQAAETDWADVLDGD